MRIALVTSEFITEQRNFDGGLANYVYRIALSLKQLGHEPVVIVSSMADDVRDVGVIRVHQVDVWGKNHCIGRLTYLRLLYIGTRYRFLMSINLLWQSYMLNRKVKELHGQQPFDIVHYAQLGAVGYFRLLSVPAIARVSGANRLAHEKGGYGESDWEFSQQDFFERRALKRMDAIFCPSRMVSRIVSEQVRRPVHVIETPFLIDVETTDPSVYREHLAGKKYLLFFGTICLIKGIATIAETIHTVLDKNPDLFVVFVGKELQEGKGGYSMASIRLKAGKHASRVLHFNRMPHEQLYPIIQGAYGVIMPSRIDNFPNACIEAMAFSKIVIGTKGNGFEQLLVDGESGFLVNVDDPVSFLEAVSTLLHLPESKRIAMGKAAAKRVEELRPEKVGQELVNFYKVVQEEKRLNKNMRVRESTVGERLIGWLQQERKSYRHGITFSFGSNWKSFNRVLSESAIERAKEDILAWIPKTDIEGKDVLDIGCGSGLHSLCFHRLGAKRILSFDADPHSVEATKHLWEKEGRPKNWVIRQMSVLDAIAMRDLGTFDVVYAWGVLHHTGKLWVAMDHACARVKPGGQLWLAIYVKGPTYPADLALKVRYNRATSLGKKKMELAWVMKAMKDQWKDGKNPLSWTRIRGMNLYHDIVDWLGGLPYEVASPEEVKHFCYNRDLRISRMKDGEANVFYLFHSIRKPEIARTVPVKAPATAVTVPQRELAMSA